MWPVRASQGQVECEVQDTFQGYPGFPGCVWQASVGRSDELCRGKEPATVTVEVAGAETEDSGIADFLETLTDISDALKDYCISWGGTTTTLLATSIK